MPPGTPSLFPLFSLPMRRIVIASLLVLAGRAAMAEDVYVPPVPRGIVGEGLPRSAAKPIPFPSAKEEWIRVRSPHFELISSAGEKRTRDIALRLETLAAALAQLHPRLTVAPSVTRVLIFSRRRESQPWFDMLVNRQAVNVSGVFVQQRGGGTIVLDSSRDWASDRTAFHELVHTLLTTGDARPPLWLDEGLAEYFGNAELRADSVWAGQPIRHHVDLLQRMKAPSLEQLVAVKHEEAAGGSPQFYAASWAAVDWLIETNRDAFYEFLRDVESGAPVVDALQLRYRKSLRDLQHAIAIGGSPAGLLIDTPVCTGGNCATAASLTTAPLTRADILYELGAFASTIEGVEHEGTRHLRAALEADSRHARALAALGQYEAALAAAPGDPEVHLAYAEHLLGDAIGPFAQMFEAGESEAAKFRNARQLAERALTLGGDEARARGIIGVTYLVETDRSRGIEELERARTLAPRRDDLRLHLYAFYLQAGNSKEAALLASIFERSRNAQVRFAAKAIHLRVETDHVNDLIGENKLEEAAARLRALATAAGEEQSRREFELQAENLVRLAATNREITTYNEAIRQYNTGSKRAALKTVEALLATATDPVVIRDAQSLRKELRQ
jgi:hypothetical protein